MTFIGRERNKLGTGEVSKYKCAKGHNNRYAYTKGQPPCACTVNGWSFQSKEEGFLFAQGIHRDLGCRPKVWDCKERRLIKYEDLIRPFSFY